MEGVDGLKTGYIDESGYNFAAAAEKDGRRLVLVTLGGPGDSTYDGSLRRAFDAAALFSYGFYGWSTYTYPITAARRLRIWGGAADELGISYSPAEPMTIPAIDVGGLVFSTVFDELTYPVEAGTPVGRWHLNTACGKELQSGVILSEETVSRGNFFKRLKDGILRFFRPDK
jgi:D-alanyl-D-alanine carboxypeptidase (penicillin-binding protein 5/6)